MTRMPDYLIQKYRRGEAFGQYCCISWNIAAECFAPTVETLGWLPSLSL